MEKVLGTLLLAMTPLMGWGDEPGSASHWNRQLGTGINLGNALEAPNEGEWGMTLEEDYFQLISEAGFDSVRIPVRWSAHTEKKAPYTIDPEFFARVDWTVEQSLKRDLVAVLNMHHFEELYADPAGQQDRFLAMWRQIADHYRDRPPSLLFEVLNEPHGELTHEHWNPLVAKTVRAIRKSNPTRALVVGPAGWNNHAGLKDFCLPPGDTNLIATIHYYLPFHFTHQGASWVGGNSREWLGTHWRGTEAEKAEVSRHLTESAAWAREHGIPLYLGEFGAYEKADLTSRVAWTRFVREEAHRLNMSVAYWEFGAGFGVYDREAECWRPGLLDALLGDD